MTRSSVSTSDRAAAAALSVLQEKFLNDPYFAILKKFKTKDEHDSKNPEKPFPDKHYLHWLLEEWHDSGENTIYVAKSRQLMVSWLLAAYGLWTALSRPHATVLWQSTKLEHAAPFIFEKGWRHARMSMLLGLLPEYLRVCRMPDGSIAELGDVDQYGSFAKLTLPNGSKIEGLAQGAQQVEGKVPSLFISDEGSLQEQFASAMAAVKPAIDGDAKLLAVGTMRLPSSFGDQVSPSWDSNPDQEGRGLAKFKTSEGTYGLRVHYSADPDKDPETDLGYKWKMGQLQSGAFEGGEHGWRWQQHMEINPLSRAGTLCIPAFRDIERQIVIPDLNPSQTLGWSFDAGLDWGAQNNAVFLVFGIRPDNRRFLLWEVSAPGNELGGIVGFCDYMQDCPWFERVNGNIQSDPSLWNKDQGSAQNRFMRSKASIFEECGVELVPARLKGQSADEIGLERLNYHYWRDPYYADFEPIFFICENAKNTIKNFPNLVYEEYSEATRHEHQLKETMKDLHVDEWDAFKYAEVATEDPPRYSPRPKSGTYGWFKHQYELRAVAKKESGDLY